MPRLAAASTQASNATCNGVSSMFVRFIDTCAIPYSFTNQPIALTYFNAPGMRTGSPFASNTGFPHGLPSFVFALPLAHIKRDRGRAPHRLRVQVYVISDQEIAD